MAKSKEYTRRVTDIGGQKFGRWLVLGRAETPSYEKNQGRAYWLCRCDCGKEKIVSGKAMRSGQSHSCGCLQIERTKESETTHGHAKPNERSETYRTWSAMRARCLNEKEPHYERYGGRGIAICERWNSFEAFLEDMGERPPGKTLDRYPNNDGNYEPGNCRWATRKEQQDNRSVSLNYEHNGRRMSLKDWSRELGISYSTLRLRIRKQGWTVERAFSTPILIDRSQQCR